MGLCAECAKDFLLKQIIETKGSVGRCIACEKRENKVLSAPELVENIRRTIEDHFELTTRLNGLELNGVVAQILGSAADAPGVSKITKLVLSASGSSATLGKGKLYSAKLSFAKSFDTWEMVLDELKNSRRFFSQRTTKFFGQVVEAAIALKVNTLTGIKDDPLLWLMDAGKTLYRGRAAQSEKECKEILKRPKRELGPVPKEKAKVGRMSPAGVPLFYSAADGVTAIAEVRPCIGQKVVIGAFRTTHSLRIFDFQRLIQLPIGYKPVSHFDPLYEFTMHNRGIALKLHELIARPVLPGSEENYLITQALTEYLSYVHDKPYDGIAFQSVQAGHGRNVVLFPSGVYGTKGLIRRRSTFPIEWAGDDPTVSEILSILYTAKKVTSKPKTTL